MSTWNPNRNPDVFLAFWHELITRQPGRYALARVEDQRSAKRLQNKFNAFKASLRAHPLHPTTQELAKRTIRVTVEPLEYGGLCLWVETKWAGKFADTLLKAIHVSGGL